MAFFEVHGGDFKVGGVHQISGNELDMELLKKKRKKGLGRGAHIIHGFLSLATVGVWMMVWFIHYRCSLSTRREKIPLTAVAEVEIATEESSWRWGRGAVGLVLLGPLGLLGALATKKKVTFLATLKDGRKFLATANQKIYQTILGATI